MAMTDSNSRPRKAPSNSRILAAEVMKSMSFREAFIILVKNLQLGGKKRETMIRQVADRIVDPMARRLSTVGKAPRYRKSERARFEKKDVAQPEPVPIEYDFTPADVDKAAVRLLRKIPALVRCENETPKPLPPL